MKTIEFRRSSRLAAAVVAPVAAFAIACGNADANTEAQQEANAAPFTGPTHAEFISSRDVPADAYAQPLNDWLKGHPALSIVSLATAADRHGDLYGFEAVVSEHPNAGESCEYLDLSKDSAIASAGPRAFGATAIQKFTEKHAGEGIIIANVPTDHSDDIGGDGNRGYVACALPK